MNLALIEKKTDSDPDFYFRPTQLYRNEVRPVDPQDWPCLHAEAASHRPQREYARQDREGHQRPQQLQTQGLCQV